MGLDRLKTLSFLRSHGQSRKARDEHFRSVLPLQSNIEPASCHFEPCRSNSAPRIEIAVQRPHTQPIVGHVKTVTPGISVLWPALPGGEGTEPAGGPGGRMNEGQDRVGKANAASFMLGIYHSGCNALSQIYFNVPGLARLY
jgi:hypothetical protein